MVGIANRRRWSGSHWFALGTLILAGAGGCAQNNGATPAAAAAKDPRSASELLREMAQTYQRAKTYQDVGELRVLVEGAPEDESRPLPFLVTYERPHKVRIHALDAIVVCDGQHLRAAAQSLAGQMLERPCPAKLTLADFSADKMLDQAMRGQLEVGLPQLNLLLDPDALTTITAEATPTRLLDADFQGETCHRVAVRGPQGKAVYWISTKTHLLRKLEFPLDAIKQQYPIVSLWAEFRGARIDQDISAVAFQMEVPSDAKLVKQFVMPGPVEPAPLLGQAVDDFSLVDLSGNAVTRESLAGKVVVLDMWATWCHWCLEGLPLLDQVYRKYQDHDQVVFLAVSRDEATITDEKVRSTLAERKLAIPIVRDPKELTERVFQAQALPTTVVLGKDGTIQDYRVGFDAQVGETLPEKLEKLLAGEDLAKQEREAFERERQAYEERLQAALIDPTSADAEDAELARKPGVAK